MRLCGVSGILFSRRGEQIILLFFIVLLTGSIPFPGGFFCLIHEAADALTTSSS